LKTEKSEILVVIPTYNECESIRSLIELIFNLRLDLDVLVIDDNSPDGTGEIIEGLQGENPRLRLIRRPKKLGLGTAHIAGFKYSLENEYKKVVTMDADFSHSPNSIPELIKASEEWDVVLGSRYVPWGGVDEKWSILRWGLSRFSNLLAKWLIRLKNKDCTSGFRCYNRYVLERLDFDVIRSDGYSFLVELLYHIQRLKFEVGEVPIVFEDRRVGVSKISRKEIAKAGLTLLRLMLLRRS